MQGMLSPGSRIQPKSCSSGGGITLIFNKNTILRINIFFYKQERPKQLDFIVTDFQCRLCIAS